MNTTGIYGHSRQIENLNALLVEKTIPNALLFSGPGGVGKRLIARRFISAMFCEDENGPCLECRSCREIAGGVFSDVIELGKNEKGKIPIGDSKKHEVGSVRWLIDKLANSSVSGKYGVIVDEVDSISEAGQNALLKTIEEPPPGTCIILIGENQSRVLPTILSRSMRFKFSQLTPEDLKKVLSLSNEYRESCELLVWISSGSLSVARRLLDNDNLDFILSFAGYISGVVKRKGLLGDAPELVDGVDYEFLLTVLLGLYGFMLSGEPEKLVLVPEDIMIDDRRTLQSILKILLAMRRGLDNNLNFKIMMKGMLYSLENINMSGFSFRIFLGHDDLGDYYGSFSC